MAQPVSPSKSPSAPRRWNGLRRIAIILAIGYLALCVLLYFQQNSLLYPRQASGAILPTETATQLAAGVGLIPWSHPTPGAESPQGYVPLGFATKPAPHGTIVLFHGNGSWAIDRMHYVDAFTKRGFRTFLYEYPGYGGRPGIPEEWTIVPDARALIRSLDKAGYGPVYVWGESLGAGVAAAVCADPTLPVHGLVLLTPWDTLANVAWSHYPFIPVRLILKEKYDSIANLQDFKHPICLIRAGNDEIIPPKLSLNLFAHLPNPKKLILFDDAHHNDWPRTPDLSWWDEALNFTAPPL